MNSTMTEPKDSLSGPIDHSSNSSPFPSPGSSFLPPPRQQAHEFALPPASKLPKKNLTSTALTDMGVVTASHSNKESGTIHLPSELLENTTESTTPTVLSHLHTRAPSQTNAAASASDSPICESPANIPLSPSTPTSSFNGPRSRDSASIAQKHLSRSSLQSNRPAPQSPSRRTSAAASTGSSRSRARSISSGIVVKIRDFAFSRTDERFFGRGPDSKRMSEASASSSGGGNGKGNSGWGFKWSFPTSRFSWSFSSPSPRSSSPPPPRRASGLVNGTRYSSDSDDEDEGEYTPSKQDFDRNFTSPGPLSPSADSDTELDVPLLPGLYRALYPFIPEGTAEMALEEDQIVRILGRGGGVGWAIALKEGASVNDGPEAHALVPESYIEFVSHLSETAESE